jgi:hypothetical protein
LTVEGCLSDKRNERKEKMIRKNGEHKTETAAAHAGPISSVIIFFREYLKPSKEATRWCSPFSRKFLKSFYRF